MNRRIKALLLVGIIIAIVVEFILVRTHSYKEDQILDSETFRARSDKEQLLQVRAIGVNGGPESVLVFLKQMYPDEPSSAHELVHVVGEAAYDREGVSGFSVCDSFMRYGCYHGVILQAIRKTGYSPDTMTSLAQGCLALDKNKTTITACVHGIGHGIMWVKSYDLLASYQECDAMFTDKQDLFYCWDGVSMENVVRRSDERDTIGIDSIKYNNIYYPCDTLPLKYQPACVREHVHLVRRVFFGKDTIKTQTYCLHFIGEKNRQECFGGLGGAINQDFPNDPERVIVECKKLTGKNSIPCLSVAATQYAFGHQQRHAEEVCSALNKNDEENCRESINKAIEAMK